MKLTAIYILPNSVNENFNYRPRTKLAYNATQVVVSFVLSCALHGVSKPFSAIMQVQLNLLTETLELDLLKDTADFSDFHSSYLPLFDWG